MIQQWCKRVGQQIQWTWWRFRRWMADSPQPSPWRVKPISMRRFLWDNQYLGRAAQQLRPNVRRALIRAFKGRGCQIQVKGGTGAGKTTFLHFATCYLIYQYHCLWDPQRELGLSKGANILLPLVAQNLQIARRVLLQPIAEMLQTSPFFDVWCRPEYRHEEIRLPSGLIVLPCSTNTDRLLGTNLGGLIVDETFWSQGQPVEHCKRIYTSLLSQMVARAHGRGFPAWMYLVTVNPRMNQDQDTQDHWLNNVVDLGNREDFVEKS